MFSRRMASTKSEAPIIALNTYYTKQGALISRVSGSNAYRTLRLQQIVGQTFSFSFKVECPCSLMCIGVSNYTDDAHTYLGQWDSGAGYSDEPALPINADVRTVGPATKVGMSSPETTAHILTTGESYTVSVNYTLGKMWLAKNGVYRTVLGVVGNPSTGAGASITNVPNTYRTLTLTSYTANAKITLL
jgi:hypothetical protein